MNYTTIKVFTSPLTVEYTIMAQSDVSQAIVKNRPQRILITGYFENGKDVTNDIQKKIAFALESRNQDVHREVVQKIAKEVAV